MVTSSLALSMTGRDRHVGFHDTLGRESPRHDLRDGECRQGGLLIVAGILRRAAPASNTFCRLSAPRRSWSVRVFGRESRGSQQGNPPPQVDLGFPSCSCVGSNSAAEKALSLQPLARDRCREALAPSVGRGRLRCGIKSGRYEPSSQLKRFRA